MIEKDYIKELFQDKLTSHEVPVRADLWTSVSSSIGGSSVVATSMSIATKIIIAVSVSAVAFVTFYLVNDKTSAPTPFKKEHPQEQKIIPVDTLKIEKEEVKKEEKLLPKQAEQRVDCEYDFSTPENDSDLKSDFHKSNINKEIVTEKGPQKIEQQDPIIRNNSTSTSEIVANPELTTKEQESTVLLPNIFTPNGDGKNDFLSIKIGEVTEFSVVILNQANKVIFTSNDPNFSWDGLAKNGEISPAGTYVYYISAKDLNGKLLTKYSSLTISY
ncbi:MAG: gliding motility-associated C-terminal domain-containing protein [Flavobacteriales bacterium]|nr:gliding motility-associated C-terminal domain-containing protein [Flavobacteriia bacterium]NDC93435.1 gliding motility-associated C-terminal domain-containing protein [Flavobacteriales bacterium]